MTTTPESFQVELHSPAHLPPRIFATVVSRSQVLDSSENSQKNEGFPLYGVG